MAAKLVPFTTTEMPSKLLRWKVNIGTLVSAGGILFTYKNLAPDCVNTVGPEKNFKINLYGKLISTLANPDDLIRPGVPVIVLEECTHPMIMKDLCAECGADLKQERMKNKNVSPTRASVPMVHSIPELKVTPELAEKIGKEDEKRLLRDKKLVLLVDLDQTIVHTTNDNVPQNLPDVIHYQLYGPRSPFYHTKLRPHTRKFLKEISNYYELHICTFGARMYAHMVTRILDNDGSLFSHRILSRDECFDPASKTANLKALFPCGDDMVCIIDDREDVWQGCGANLVQVKPYHYFRHTGDIHAPPGFGKEEQPPSLLVPDIAADSSSNEEENTTNVENGEIPDISGEYSNTENIKNVDIKVEVTPEEEIEKQSEENMEIKSEQNPEEKTEKQSEENMEIKFEQNPVEKTEKQSEENMEIKSEQNPEEKPELKTEDKSEEQVQKIIEEKVQENPTEEVEKQVDEQKVQISEEKLEEKSENITEQTTDEQNESSKQEDKTKRKYLESNIIPSDVVHEDDDDYLLYLEDILKRIHTEYYNDTETDPEKKTLKNIIPRVKAKVLKGIQITFSGLIPNHQKLEQSRAYRIAKAFGAQVSQDLNGQTTHLVAIRRGTAKDNVARKNGRIKIVNPDWLWTCAERWERVDERLFPLTTKARGSRIPPHHCNTTERMEDKSNELRDSFANSINPLMSFSREEIDKMDKEVDEDMENELDSCGSSSDETDEESADEDDYHKSKKSILFQLQHNREDYDSNDDSMNEEEVDHMMEMVEKRGASKRKLEGNQDDGDDPITKFRRGEYLSDDEDLGDPNSQNSVDVLSSNNLEDDREWNEMGAALEREFLAK